MGDVVKFPKPVEDQEGGRTVTMVVRDLGPLVRLPPDLDLVVRDLGPLVRLPPDLDLHVTTQPFPGFPPPEEAD